MYVHMYVCLKACVYICSMHASGCPCIYTGMLQSCSHACMHVCMCVCMFYFYVFLFLPLVLLFRHPGVVVGMSLHACTHTHTYTHTHTHTHTLSLSLSLSHTHTHTHHTQINCISLPCHLLSPGTALPADTPTLMLSAPANPKTKGPSLRYINGQTKRPFNISVYRRWPVLSSILALLYHVSDYVPAYLLCFI